MQTVSLSFQKNMSKTKYISLLLILLCTSFNCSSIKRNSTQIIILKLDDLWNKERKVHQGWEDVISYLNENNIKSTIGIIGESLETEDEVYFNWVKKRHNEGHEIWNHGYCHCKPLIDGETVSEFRDTPLEYQFEQLQKTQTLAKEKLGITLTTFGAPYNHTDSVTAVALDRLPEIKNWFYNETNHPSSKKVYSRINSVNIEYPVHKPNFELFKKGYIENRTQEIITIQGHPRSWISDPNRILEFKKIIAFLKDENVTFSTPSKLSLLN